MERETRFELATSSLEVLTIGGQQALWDGEKGVFELDSRPLGVAFSVVTSEKALCTTPSLAKKKEIS